MPGNDKRLEYEDGGGIALPLGYLILVGRP